MSEHERRRPPWLRPETELALAPDLRIIDPHHHFWDGGFMAERFGAMTPPDFTAAIERSGHNIVASVYLECSWSYRDNGPKHLRCVGETERVEAVANQFVAQGGAYAGLVSAIVGAANLSLGDAVDEVLEAHLHASPKRFRGIREVTAADPDEPLAGNERHTKMADPMFREGLARLERHGLIFETWLVHPQLNEYAALAAAFPNIPMVLDHLATPLGVGRFRDKQAEVFEAWKAGISEVARRPNVVLKLGGFGMPGPGLGWERASTPVDSATVAEAYRPYVLHAVEAFTPERCMFESNFAVDGMSYSYGTIWNAFKRIASAFTSDEQADLFRNTAARVYGIDTTV